MLGRETQTEQTDNSTKDAWPGEAKRGGIFHILGTFENSIRDLEMQCLYLLVCLYSLCMLCYISDGVGFGFRLRLSLLAHTCTVRGWAGLARIIALALTLALPRPSTVPM